MTGIPDPGHRLLLIKVSEYVVQENFFLIMSDQNSTVNNLIRPEALQDELGVKRATYYDDLKHLKIKAAKDEDGKAFLTFQEAQKVRALRSYVIKYGARKGFNYEEFVNENNIGSSIIKAEESDIETQTAIATTTGELAESGIYVTEEETDPTNKVNQDNIIRTAQELAARNIAIPYLIAVELANSMEFDDLPEDLQKKIIVARDASNPKKHQPRAIADGLLKQLRSQRAA